MLDQKRLKTEGLRFARALQIAVRTAGLLSIDHSVAAAPLQQSFDALVALLKETREFTVGFVDNRVMLNNILTTEPGLAQLESDFLKRAVGGLKFSAGITLARYKQVIALLSTPIKTIEAQGGARAFVARNPVEGVRIFPASKTQKRTEAGDTLLEMDTEAFLLSRDGEPAHAVPFADALGMLFESAGLERPQGVGNPTDIMRAIGPTLETALVGQGANPEQAYVALAHLLKGVNSDVAVAAFAPERQPEVRTLPPEQMAAELVQDTALGWAARYVSSAPAGTDAYVVEEEVVRVLARTLRATQMSERLAAKLASFIKEYAFPATTYEKIQDELKWVALPMEQKQAKLLQTPRFGRLEFRRLMDHVKELLRNALVPEATEVATHYFDFLDAETEEIQPEELSRAPELIVAMAGVRTGFAQKTADKLIEALQREQDFKHLQLVNALGALCKSNAIYEEFELAQVIGSALEQSLATDSAKHANCCGKTLENLLPANSIERLIEIFIEKRDDSAWSRNVAIMLRRAGVPGIEILFQRLEEETVAGNRLALLRLLGRTGSAGIAVARRRLVDNRWYVVRNACIVLGELKDPELLQQLTPVLPHPDARVQKAALDAIIKSRIPGRAQVFAAVLSYLDKHLLEGVLEELLFLKDPASLPDLEHFLLSHTDVMSGVLQKAVQAVAAVPVERSLEVLGKVLAEPKLDAAVRRLALRSLAAHPSERSRQLLAEIAANAGDDPLAAECKQAASAKA